MAQMADDIIVVGKGKLIAQGSVNSIIANSANAGVYVRSDNKAKLCKALDDAKITYVDFEAGLKVTGVSTEEVGKLLYQAGLPVLELSKQDASLEEAFLELTADSEEFATKGAK
jgi:ABC-2 type transport system ATP-binding protein